MEAVGYEIKAIEVGKGKYWGRAFDGFWDGSSQALRVDLSLGFKLLKSVELAYQALDADP